MLTFVLLGTALFFTGAGLVYTRFYARTAGTEEYIAARGQIGTLPAIATLFASAMGPWILFGPAEAATWGGLPAVMGYSLGSALPVLAYIPLGSRVRRRLPEGYTIAEYVRQRYGKKMHALVLLVVIFFLGISLAAQVTGVAFLVRLIANVPLWATGGLVLVSTLAYTLQGGLKASIFTDGLQTLLIIPLLIFLVVVIGGAVGGIKAPAFALSERAPDLLRWTYGPGLEGGLALVIGIGAASLFNQGTWQRVYAIDTASSLRKSFVATALINAVVVFAMGAFGLAAVGLDAAEPASTALFNVLLKTMPAWMGAGLIVLGLALVMSSADTILSAIASLVIADLGVHFSHLGQNTRQVSQWLLAVLCVPVFYVAAQGYSVLYLFLVADLICAAAVFPVFIGLFSDRFHRQSALWSTIAGMASGGLLFPPPGTGGSLLPAFAAALLAPVAVGLVLHAWRQTVDRGSKETVE
jgi:Na+/proline symporter